MRFFRWGSRKIRGTLKIKNEELGWSCTPSYSKASTLEKLHRHDWKQAVSMPHQCTACSTVTTQKQGPLPAIQMISVLLHLCSEKAMAPHSSTLAWKIPWTEEPGRLPSMGSHRVRHDWSDLAATAAAAPLLPKTWMIRGKQSWGEGRVMVFLKFLSGSENQ